MTRRRWRCRVAVRKVRLRRSRGADVSREEGKEILLAKTGRWKACFSSP